MRVFALVFPYSPVNRYLFEVSNSTLVVCTHQEDILLVIDVKAILSVVAMVPFNYVIDSYQNFYFVIEKIGIDVLDIDTQEDIE